MWKEKDSQERKEIEDASYGAFVVFEIKNGREPV
jgi:hypothetical protein